MEFPPSILHVSAAFQGCLLQWELNVKQMRSFMKEYVGEQETGFCHPKPKWSSSAGAIDHKADHLLSSRKPHPTLGCLCCWRAQGWDKQVWRKCDSAACLKKLCCFSAFVLSSCSGCPWVGCMGRRKRLFPVNPSNLSFNIQSRSCWSFNLPSSTLHTPD